MALDVSANNISGALPDQLAGGPAPELQYLYLSRNSLTGARQASLCLRSVSLGRFLAAYLPL